MAASRWLPPANRMHESARPVAPRCELGQLRGVFYGIKMPCLNLTMGKYFLLKSYKKAVKELEEP